MRERNLGMWLRQRRPSRRQVLVGGLAGTAAWLLGCGGAGQQVDIDALPPDGGGTDAGGDAGGLDSTPACDETEDNIEGPFYKPDAPLRADLTDGVAGTRLALAGTVLSTSCAPLGGAELDVWQANDAGAYDNAGYTLRGRVVADAEGRFALTTIVPGRYQNRPAHIHVKVRHPAAPLLTTQLYFAGDPFNDSDPWYLPALAMTTTDEPDGSKRATFDFVLRTA